MSLKTTAIFLAAMLVAACTASEKPATTDTGFSPVVEAVDTVQLEPPPAADTTVQSPPPSTEPPVTGWVVTPKGIGPVTAGMTLDQASKATNNGLIIPAKLSECDYVRLKNGPKGVTLMVEQGRISRANINEGSVVTAEGARIGDTERRIKSLYPGVAVQPHKYTDGHYLVVIPKSAADSAYRIIFETDGSKVLRYRSGKRPAVEYVEGCS